MEFITEMTRNEIEDCATAFAAICEFGEEPASCYVQVVGEDNFKKLCELAKENDTLIKRLKVVMAITNSCVRNAELDNIKFVYGETAKVIHILLEAV